MTSSPLSLPGGRRHGLYLVDRPLLVERYRRALQLATGHSTRLERFFVDPAGYSPEVAAELEDPHYLGSGPVHPSFLIVSVDQLDGPRIQPNAGFSAVPFRDWVEEVRSHLADLTLSEAVHGEWSHGVTRFQHPGQLAMVRTVSLELHTPSERLAHAEQLGRLRTELLGSDTAWRDEEFLEGMQRHAALARGWVGVPDSLLPGRVRECGPAFLPEFGGCFVWPGRTPADPQGWVLCGGMDGPEAAAWTARAQALGVVLLPLGAEVAARFLVERGLTAVRARAGHIGLERLDRLQVAIARDHLRTLGRPTPGVGVDPRRVLRREQELPEDFLELEDLRLEIRSGRDWVDLSSYSPLCRLRAMPLLGEDPAARAWARQLRHHLDPIRVTDGLLGEPEILEVAA